MPYIPREYECNIINDIFVVFMFIIVMFFTGFLFGFLPCILKGLLKLL